MKNEGIRPDGAGERGVKEPILRRNARYLVKRGITETQWTPGQVVYADAGDCYITEAQPAREWYEPIEDEV